MVKTYWAILTLGLIVTSAFPTVPRAGQAAPRATASLIAVVRQRIETDRLQVRVFQGKRLVQLAPFMELFVVTAVPGQSQRIENLASRSVAIVRSKNNPERWEVYQDLWVGKGLEDTLADNVFKVKQVLSSSAQSPIEVRLDEHVVRLKPGDALLVL